MMKAKENQLNQLDEKVKEWQTKNKRLSLRNETLKFQKDYNESLITEAKERQRECIKRRNLKLIMKRTRMASQIKENYNELLAMQAQLELLKLRTFPTLGTK